VPAIPRITAPFQIKFGSWNANFNFLAIQAYPGRQILDNPEYKEKEEKVE